MSKKLTKEQVIENLKAVHGDRYDYSLLEYVDMHKHYKNGA